MPVPFVLFFIGVILPPAISSVSEIVWRLD